MPAHDSTLGALNGIQPQRLFQNLPGLLDHYAWIFIAAGFLLLIGGHMWRIHEAGNDGRSLVHAWYRTLLVLAFMMFAPKLLELGYAAVNEVASSSGMDSPTSVTRKCIRLAMNTPELEPVLSRFSRNAQLGKGVEPTSVEAAAASGGLWEYAKAYWMAAGEEVADLKQGTRHTFNAITDGPVLSASQAVCLIKAAAIFLSSTLTTMFLVFAGMAAFLMDSLRYLFLLVGSLMLPAFIAGYNTRFFCQQGHRYVTSMVSVLLWPVWWMFGHVGTVGLFDAYVSLLGSCSAGGGGAAGSFADSFNWDHIDATLGGAASGSGTGVDLMALGASTPFLSLGLIALGAFGLFAWVFLVTVGGPYLGHKLVVAGANVYGATISQRGTTAISSSPAVSVVNGTSGVTRNEGVSGREAEGADRAQDPGPVRLGSAWNGRSAAFYEGDSGKPGEWLGESPAGRMRTLKTEPIASPPVVFIGASTRRNGTRF